jgi:hypothetical protein
MKGVASTGAELGVDGGRDWHRAHQVADELAQAADRDDFDPGTMAASRTSSTGTSTV